MLPPSPHKPVTVAHEKAVAVQDDVREAEANLHDANEALADTVDGTVPTKESVEAALVQNLQVEGQLHAAVKELQVVSDLLKVAQEEKAAHDDEDAAVAGHRSGEGVDSVIEHLASTAGRRTLNR